MFVNINYVLPVYFTTIYENIIFSAIFDIKCSILANFLEKSGKNITFFFDYLFPFEIKEKTTNIGNPLSVVTPEQMKHIRPAAIKAAAVDPHYGHSPIDWPHWKQLSKDILKPAPGFREKYRVENLFDRIIIGYISKSMLENPDLITVLPYETSHYYKGVPYERIYPYSPEERTYYHKPLGSIERRLSTSPLIPGQDRDVIRIFGMESVTYKLNFYWLETEQAEIENKIIEYCPRVVQNNVVFPERPYPYFILVVKFACKYAYEDGIIIDGNALTNWRENDEYFKYFCSEILYKYLIRAIKDTDLAMAPPVHLRDHVPKGYKCW